MGTRAARLAVALAVMLMVVPVPPGQALSITGFRNDLVNLLLDKLSIPGQFEVRADAVDEVGGRRASLTGLTVSDERGVWFRAGRLVFEWDPTALLSGEARITELRLAGGRLERLPSTPPAADGEPSPAAATEADGVAEWPRSPLALSVAALVIEDMRIADAVAPGGIAFDARGRFTDADAEQSARLDLERTDRVPGSIAVAYTKRFDTGRLDLIVEANEGPAGLVAALTGLPDDVPTRLDLKAAGPAGELEGGLSVAADGLFAARGTTAADWKDRLTLDLALDVVPGDRLDRALADAIGANARLEVALRQGDDDRVIVRSGQFRSGALTAALQGHLERDSGALDLRLDVKADGDAAERLSGLLAPARVAGLEAALTVAGVPGDLAVRGDVSVTRPHGPGFRARDGQLRLAADQAPGNRLDFSVDGTLAGADDESGRLRALLGPTVTLTVRGRQADDAVTLEQARVAGTAVRADVQGRIELGAAGPKPRLAYEATLDDLAALTDLVGTPLAGRGLARGELTTNRSGKPRLVGELGARGTRIAGAGLGTVSLAHDLVLGTDITGPVDLRARGGEWGDARVRSVVRAGPGGVALTELDARAPGLQATGDLTLASGALLPTGQLALDIASLEPLGRLAGVRATGSGQLDLQLGKPRADVARAVGRLDGLAVDDLTLAAVTLDVDARLDNGAIAEVRLARLTATDLVAPAGRLDTASVEASGTLDALSYSLTGAGQRGRGDATVTLALATRGLADVARPARGSVRLDALTLDANEDRIELAAPATVSWDDGRVSVTGLQLDLPDDGRATVELTAAPGRTTGSVDIREAPLAMLGRLGLAPIDGGVVEGTVALDTAPASPRLDVDLRAGEVVVAGVTRSVGTLAASVRSRWDGRTAEAVVELTGPFETPLAGSVRLPLAASPDGAFPQPASDAPLDGRLRWQGDVAPVFALVPAPDHLLSGKLDVDVRVGGRVDAPRLSGAVSMTGGRYENLLVGTIVENLTLESRFENADAVEFTLTGDDGNAGTVQVTGRIAELGRTPSLSVAARATSFLALRLDAGSAITSAAIDVAGTTTDLAVTGRVDVEQAEIRLVDALPPSVVELGNVRIAGEPAPDTTDRAGVDDAVVRLDIVIDLPRRVFVNGRGLNSEWGGRLNVTGTAAAPDIAGRIEARRGQLDLLGKLFTLERGAVAFDGARTLDPTIDVLFVRDAGDITGQIGVTGRASAPSLGLSAVPALPEDEVLPRVLFGRSRQSLGAAQALQLAAGLQSLADGRAGVLDRTRAALGLDVLRLDSGDGDDGGSGISVGRYVTDKVYVGARQGFQGKPGEVVVEVEVRSNIVIDATVGQEERSGVGISWKKDF